jgi:hypothetical protein
MQRLTLRHAKRFNRLHGVAGPLNESRFHAQVVDSERYLLALVRYIHFNPVKAGLVGRPEAWPFSSHRAYLGRGYRFVETGEVLARGGGLSGYRRLMDSPVPPEEEAVFERVSSGDREARLSDLALVGRHPLRSGPWCARLPRREMAEVLAELGREESAGASREAVEDVRGGALPAAPPRDRQLRRRWALRLRDEGFGMREIAEALDCHQPAVSRLLARARRGKPEM